MPSAPALQVVLDVLDLARSGRFAEVRERFVPSLQPLVQPEALAQAWTTELERRGRIASVGEPLAEPVPPAATLVKIPVACEHGGFTLVAAATEQGGLLSLQLAPAEAAAPAAAWEPPAYAEPASFAEEDVTVATVGGTLSLPRAAGPRPGVVLLAGSGSLDRDETVRANKPLKDIAWGLAGRGIAVLRFDKVTYTHAQALADAQDFTLTDEYLPQALAAIHVLQDQPAVDRVFLLGHSLGGTVAPRVAAAEPAVAGLVLLAAGAQPLHWAIVRQARHLASLSPGNGAAAEATLAALTRQAERVDRSELAGELPLGAPAAYWRDLRDYRPAELAATLGKPMLILQGGRDYQVTVADDLKIWRAALPDATIRIHPALNHLFAAGDGPSSPAEYERPQHVDPAVIDDIAGWLS